MVSPLLFNLLRHISPGFLILSMFCCSIPCPKIDSQVSVTSSIRLSSISVPRFLSCTPSSCHASLVQGWRYADPINLRIYISTLLLSYFLLLAESKCQSLVHIFSLFTSDLTLSFTLVFKCLRSLAPSRLLQTFSSRNVVFSSPYRRRRRRRGSRRHLSCLRRRVHLQAETAFCLPCPYQPCQQQQRDYARSPRSGSLAAVRHANSQNKIHGGYAQQSTCRSKIKIRRCRYSVTILCSTLFRPASREWQCVISCNKEKGTSSQRASD